MSSTVNLLREKPAVSRLSEVSFVQGRRDVATRAFLPLSLRRRESHGRILPPTRWRTRGSAGQEITTVNRKIVPIRTTRGAFTRSRCVTSLLKREREQTERGRRERESECCIYIPDVEWVAPRVMNRLKNVFIFVWSIRPHHCPEPQSYKKLYKIRYHFLHMYEYKLVSSSTVVPTTYCDIWLTNTYKCLSDSPSGHGVS